MRELQDMRPKKIPGRKIILEHFDRRDPVIARVIRDYGPMRLTKNRNYFIVLCRAIISQQISTKAADSVYKKFDGLFDGRSPNPERVAVLRETVLRSAGLSRQKAAYLKDLGAKFLDGTIRPHQLRCLSNEEAVDRLTEVYGIGQWTAEMFLIFSLNRPDVLPVGDLGLQAAIKNIYGLRQMPTAKKIRTLGRKWSPLETVATWYAWRSIDEDIIAY